MFSARTISFLEKAARAKDPSWLEKNRKLYETEVKAPFVEIIMAMDARFGRELPQFRFSPRSLSRPMRQPQNVEEKGLYKNYIACPMGRKKASRFEYPPSFYLFISPDEIFFAAGLYRPSSAQMKRIRLALQEDARQLARIVSAKPLKRYYGGLSPNDMTRAPRGFSVEKKYLPLLIKRSFTVHRVFTVKQLTSRSFLSRVLEGAEIALPLVRWLDQTVSK